MDMAVLKKNRLYLLFLGLSLAGYGLLALKLYTGFLQDDRYSICLFKSVTGLPCPSCGTTRSVVLLLHGYILQSILLNPFGLILTAAMVIVPIWITGDLIFRKESFYHAYTKTDQFIGSQKWFFIPAIGLILANWVWNILKGL
jgi:hypothetical protein